MRAAPRLDNLAFGFGHCTVHVPTRELRIHGQVQAVPPKVFDVLVHLVRHRQRVVSKQELLQQLWHTDVLSDSVVSRTVMLVRRLIGDTADVPQWIQNVYGIGYRFIGDVIDTAAAPAAQDVHPLAAAGPSAGRRIAILPLDNRTQDAKLHWTRIGLMALVGHALEKHTRLGVITLEEGSVPRDPSGGPMLSKAAEQARDAYGVHDVVHAVLRQQAGSFWLDYQVLRPQEPTVFGSLTGGDPLLLGERFAQDLGTLVLNGEAFDGDFLSADPFVNLAFARSAEFLRNENWPAALAMLSAACTLEPDIKQLEMERVRCLVFSRSPLAVTAAEKLLGRLTPDDTAALHCRCHDLMTLALLVSDLPDTRDRQAHHQDMAMAFAGQCEPVDWVITMRCNAANQYLAWGQLDLARRTYDLAEQQSRASNNALRLALTQQNFAVLDHMEGNLPRARQRLEEAVHIWRRGLFDRPLMKAHALVTQAAVSLNLGLFEEAGALCGECISAVEARALNGWAPVHAASACLIYCMLGDRAGVMRVVGLFSAAACDTPPSQPEHDCVLACAALCHGQAGLARTHLQSAVAKGSSWPGPSFVRRCLMLQLRLDLQHGDTASLAQTRPALQAIRLGPMRADIESALLVSQAASLHLQGQGAQALDLLLQAVHDWPPNQTTCEARLNAAWLLLEQGQADRARALIDAVPNWRDTHPGGLAVQASAWAAQGDFGRAAQLQARALRLWPGSAHPWHQRAAAAYAGAKPAAARKAVAALGRLPRLLSATWLAGEAQTGHA